MNKNSLKKMGTSSKIKKSLRKKGKEKKNMSKGGTLFHQVSDFSDNLKFKRFDCRQPFWDSSCI